MANPYNDPRYAMVQAMRQQKQAQQGLAPLNAPVSSTGVSYGRQARNMVAANPELRDAIAAIGRGETSKGPKAGLLGTVLGNPITQGILKPLGVLALPGKSVVSALREGVDFFDGNADTKASFGDFKKQVSDPEFGFGKAFNIDTGSKWLDRAVGFVGDVATDPLTYVTFGAGKFASYSQKLELAGEVLRKTGDEALAAAVSRVGRAAIKDNALLKELGANRHGLYVLGKRIKVGEMQQGLRIPGTGALGQIGENAMAKLRLVGNESKLRDFIRTRTLPSDDLVARKALLSGKMVNGAKLPDKSAAALVGYFSSSPAMRMELGRVAQLERAALAKVLEEEGSQGIENYAKEIHKYLEDPELLATATPEIQRAAQVWGAGFFGNHETQVSEMLKAVDPLHTGFEGVANYFPRMHTDDAQAYRINPNSPYAKDLEVIYSRDPMEGGQNFKNRTLAVDDKWFGTKLTAEHLKSTETLNELARKGGFVGDFFETDVRKVAARYVDEFAKESAVLYKHKHLADTGFWERADEIEQGAEFIDKTLVANVKKNLRSLTTDLRNAHMDSVTATLKMTDAVTNYQAALAKQLADGVDPATDAGARALKLEQFAALDESLSTSTQLGADQVLLITKALGKTKKDIAGLFGYEIKAGKLINIATGAESDNVDFAFRGLIDYLDNLEQESKLISEAMVPIEGNVKGIELAQAHKEAVNQRKLLEATVQRTADLVEEVMAFGNQLEGALVRIANGELDATITLQRAVTDVLTVSGYDTGSFTFSKELIDKASNVEGSLQTFLRDTINSGDSVYDNLTMYSPLSKDSITKMDVEQLKNSLVNIQGDNLSLEDVRSIGIHMLLSDERIFGTEVPQLLVDAREKLIEQLRLADQGQRIANDIIAAGTSEGGRITTYKLWNEQTRPAIDRARVAQDSLEAVTKWDKTFRSSVYATSLENLDRPLNVSRIYEMIGTDPSLNWVEDLLPPQTSARDSIESLMSVGDSIDPEQITLRDFLGRLDNVISQKSGLLDLPVYEFGSGVGQKVYTGRQLIALDNKRNALQSSIEKLNRKKAAALKIKLAELTPEGGFPNTAAGQVWKKNIRAQAEFTALTKDEWALLEKQKAEVANLVGGPGLQKTRWFTGVAKTKESLGDAISTYSMLSEVTNAWNSAVNIQAGFGLVPSEAQLSNILQNVARRYVQPLDKAIMETHSAIEMLKRIDADIAAKLAANTAEEGGQTAGKIFADHIAGLSSDEYEVLRAAVGTKAMAFGDPYTLARNRSAYRNKRIADGLTSAAADREYLETRVQPWFEQAFPDKTPTLKNMKAALAGPRSAKLKGALQSAWSESADPNVVKRWFEELIGTSQVNGKSQHIVGYVGESGSENFRRVTLDNGSLETRLDSLRKTRYNYESLSKPDLNIGEFLDDPLLKQGKTPTTYAMLLDDVITKQKELVRTAADSEYALRQSEAFLAERVANQSQAAKVLEDFKRGIVPEPMMKQLDAVKSKVDAIDNAERAVVDAKAKQTAVSKEMDDLREVVAKAREAHKAKGLKTTLPLTNAQTNKVAKLKEQLKAANKAVASAELAKTKVPALTREDTKFVGVVKKEIASRAVKDMPENVKILANDVEVKQQALVEARALSKSNLVKRETAITQAKSDLDRAKKALKEGEKTAAVNVTGEAPYSAQIDEATRQYDEMISTTLHSKANRDKEFVDVVDALADTDMHLFADGFVLPDGRVAVGADGQKIVFSKAEWDSLYVGERFVSDETLKGLVKDRQEIINDIDLLSRQREGLLVEIDRAARSPEPSIRTVAGILSGRRTDKLKSVLETVEERIAGRQKDLTGINTHMDQFRPGVKQSATRKMKILVHGTKDQPPVFSPEGLASWNKWEHATQRTTWMRQSEAVPGVGSDAQKIKSWFLDPANFPENTNKAGVPVSPYKIKPDILRQRKAAVQGAWRRTAEFEHLKALDELNNNVFVLKNAQLRSSPQLTDDYVRALERQHQAALAKHAVDNKSIADAEAEMVMRAEQASKALVDMKNGGPPPLDAEGLPLPIPKTIDEAAVFADTVREQAKYTDFTLKVDESLENTRLNNALTDATDATEKLETAQLLEEQAKAAEAAWTTRPRDAKGKPIGLSPRDAAMKEASDLLKSKVTKEKAVREVIDAVLNARNNIRAEFELTHGGADGYLRAFNENMEFTASLQAQLDEVNILVKDLPPQDAMDVLKELKANKGGRAATLERLTPERASHTMSMYRDWATNNEEIIRRLGADPENPVYKAWAAAGLADKQLIDLELTHWKELTNLEAASTPVWVKTVIGPLADDYEKIAKKNGILKNKSLVDPRRFPSLYGESEAVDLLNSVARLNQPGVAADLARFMSGYTGFFKAYATLSPGFHIRNEIGNVFQMFAAGADVKNMMEGFKLWRMMDSHLATGGTIDSFVDMVPEAQREAARGAAMVAAGLSGGKTQDALSGFMKEGNRIRSNRALDLSQKTGRKLEGSAHFMLAYDGMQKGFTTNESFNRTGRYLIDYNSKSLLDESMRDIIPFWTWMSRNLPLQIVNRWANPRPYLMYQHLMQNINSDQDGSLTPEYLKNALNLGNNKYINLDLPFSKVNEQIDQITNPSKLLGYVNPGIRVPLELMFNKDLYTGNEMSDKQQRLTGLNSLLQLPLQAMGQINYNDAGEAVAPDKWVRAFQQMIPPLGQAQRIGDKGWNSWVGLPYTEATANQVKGTEFGRLEQLQKLADKQRNIREAK